MGLNVRRRRTAAARVTGEAPHARFFFCWNLGEICAIDLLKVAVRTDSVQIHRRAFTASLLVRLGQHWGQIIVYHLLESRENKSI
jgi:hypothetical protein